jgi:hypothetical protein
LRDLTAKRRNKERDAEIVRLRDEIGMSFGKIPRALMEKRREWSKGGKPLDRNTVEMAYSRSKKSPKEAAERYPLPGEVYCYLDQILAIVERMEGDVRSLGLTVTSTNTGPNINTLTLKEGILYKIEDATD